MNTKGTVILIFISIIVSYFAKFGIDYYLKSNEFKNKYSLYQYVTNDKIIDKESYGKRTVEQQVEFNEELFYNIKISKEVEEALKYGKAIVSLESTIISHGMPYPQNYETALQVESIIRSYGVVPATIAILNGTIHIGLTDSEIHYLAKVGKDAIKTSRRDIAIVTSQGKTGSTTVSATILFSNLVGIKVFVTGGLGGVHRGAETSLDISADLTELGKNGIMVVSAGVKSILDIQKTLEYLETQGVTVATYGSNEFPAFFTKHSGVSSPNRIDTIEQCAKLLYSNQLLNLKSGIVIAVPPLDNEHSDEIDRAIKESIEQSIKDQIVGKDITPYLLKKVNEKTGGKSLDANIELVKNNARIGSQISKEYYNLLKNKQSHNHHHHNDDDGIKGDELVFNYFDQRVNSFLTNYFNMKLMLESKTKPFKQLKGSQPNKRLADNHIEYDVVIIGGAVIDMISHPFKESGFQMATSNPGTISIKMGGVGRNVAEVLSRLQMNSLFISLLGDDLHSNIMFESFNSLNLTSNGVGIKVGSKTAIYNAIMDNRGDLAVAIAQMDIFDEITPSYIAKFDLSTSKLLVFDGNIPIDSMLYLAKLSKEKGIKLWFEPTSVYKSAKIIDPLILSSLTYISPNRDELIKISNEIVKKGLIKFENIINNDNNDKNDLENIKKHSIILIESGIKYIITKMGARGVLLAYKENGEFKFELFSAPDVQDDKIVDVTGAGDSLVGCTIYSLMQGHNLTIAIPQFGTLCAKESLLSTYPVSPKIKISLFK